MNSTVSIIFKLENKYNARTQKQSQKMHMKIISKHEHESNPTDGAPDVDRRELHDRLQLELEEKEEGDHVTFSDSDSDSE